MSKQKSKQGVSRGKRLLKRAGKIMFGIILTLILISGSGYIINKVSLKREASQIKVYGEKIPLFDGEVNVVDIGKGEETIVLLPGQGTASPYLDFKPMVNELKKNYRVIVVEPFGYGLSSQTNRKRSVANITEEIHEIVKTLGLKKYTLMGHSIAGLYAVNYAQEYADEMNGFIGIDSSVANQPWPGIDMRPLDFLKEIGVLRAMIKVNPESALGMAKSNSDFEQMRLITLKNMSSRNLKEELKELDTSFPASRGLMYPKDMPVLLFVADNDQSMANWIKMHEDQISNLTTSKLVPLKGTHYLHHTQTPKIVEEVTLFTERNF
ncbi:alpha/beta hydrolase [Vagococcus sp. PNs007]|uniref:Alpha/beta hydrolase n=1 Tax=Vagococcus proximus TaxID=2991417 RepID=A0ABT5X3U5_9ENTE|nr:alpha/beta hydrolase [Vagococcus proximus]MDF0480677.1 alpha/beta hydrolase [Vagococcus proximus]